MFAAPMLTLASDTYQSIVLTPAPASNRSNDLYGTCPPLANPDQDSTSVLLRCRLRDDVGE